MSTLAVSSWSLHRALGPTYWGLDRCEGDRAATYPYGPGTLTLLDLPAAVAALDIGGLEICHFHFPRTDDAYLRELRGRLSAAGVQPLTLLIDEGDISAADPAARTRDMERIRGWIDVAAAIGAQRARVIAGLAPADAGEAALRRSAEGLAELGRYGASVGVHVVTENWLGLSLDPANLLAIVDEAGADLRLCVDFGNYTGPGKYDGLAALLPHATSIHAKAAYSEEGEMDRAEFRRCLDLARQAAFSGAYVLIFQDEGDERAHLTELAETVRPYL